MLAVHASVRFVIEGKTNQKEKSDYDSFFKSRIVRFHHKTGQQSLHSLPRYGLQVVDGTREPVDRL
jgi:hypothetical protein